MAKKNNKVVQGTPEWLHLKKGLLTSTDISKLMGTPYAKKEFFYEYVARRLTVGVGEDYENAMDRGTRLEPEAVAVFELKTGLSTEVVGLVEGDEHIGNSPDRYVGKDAALEVKCPQGKNYVKIWLANEIPKEYHWQCVHYFVVNDDIKKVYFAAYNPDIPVHPLHIIEMNREDVEEDIKKAKSELNEFIKSANNKLKGIIKL